MTRPTDIDMLSDIEALSESIVEPRKLEHCNRGYKAVMKRAAVARGEVRYVSSRVTLPKLKFLQNGEKDD